MMPIALLAMISSPNAPLITDPVDSTMTSSTPRIALMRVNTLARTMSDTLRAARVGHVVGLAFGDPLRDFGIGEPGGDIGTVVILVNVPLPISS